MSDSGAGRALALCLVDEFARGGVADAVLSPGSRSAPIAYALAAHAGISVHVLLDERSAGFLAIGLAKASRRPVAVLTTSGTAAVNLHPAIVEAHEARVPLLALTADRPPELRATGAGQTIDQIQLFGAAVRMFAEVGVAEARPDAVRYWRSLAARAVASAIGSPPGPVHLNLVFRDPLVPANENAFPYPLDGRPDGRPWVEVSRGPRPAPDLIVDRVAREIAGTAKGVLLAGESDADPEAVTALARAAGWPLIAEPQSGARWGEHAISTADALLRHEPFAAVHRPDLAVRVGRLSTSKTISGWLGPSVRQILIDPDAGWLDPERNASWSIDSDPTLLCADVAKALPARRAAWLEDWREAERGARRALDEALDATDEPFEARAARDVAATLPDGSALFVASSMPVRDLDWFMQPRRGLRVFANRGANGIDGTVSSAIGIARAAPGPAAALVGDLALLHDQNGLLSSRAEPVNLAIVVLNNDGGGIFSFLPQAEHDHFETLFGTPHGIAFDRLAAVYDIGYARAERAGDLPAELQRAVASGGIHLIEVTTRRTENVLAHRRVWDAVAAAIS